MIDTAVGAVLSRLQNLRRTADYSLDTFPAADTRRATDEAEGFVATVHVRWVDVESDKG